LASTPFKVCTAAANSSMWACSLVVLSSSALTCGALPASKLMKGPPLIIGFFSAAM
jgi:hypothetical protein